VLAKSRWWHSAWSENRTFWKLHASRRSRQGSFLCMCSALDSWRALHDSRTALWHGPTSYKVQVSASRKRADTTDTCSSRCLITLYETPVSPRNLKRGRLSYRNGRAAVVLPSARIARSRTSPIQLTAARHLACQLPRHGHQPALEARPAAQARCPRYPQAPTTRLTAPVTPPV
jgi:hypothetical protein